MGADDKKAQVTVRIFGWVMGQTGVRVEMDGRADVYLDLRDEDGNSVVDAFLVDEAGTIPEDPLNARIRRLYEAIGAEPKET